jgi:hypothetical protein
MVVSLRRQVNVAKDAGVYAGTERVYRTDDSARNKKANKLRCWA